MTVLWLQELSGLEVLDLSSNLVEDAGGLDSLPLLQSLDLSSNRLTCLPTLSMHTHLTHLNLRKNGLSSLEPGGHMLIISHELPSVPASPIPTSAEIA